MTGFVKICGMTDAVAVEAALRAGADAIGFVFAPSVRRMMPVDAARLARPARGRALCVAVTQHPDAATLQAVFAEFAPDVLQTDAEDLAQIALPAGVRAWPVLRGAGTPAPGARVLFEGPRYVANVASAGSGSTALSAGWQTRPRASSQARSARTWLSITVETSTRHSRASRRWS